MTLFALLQQLACRVLKQLINNTLRRFVGAPVGLLTAFSVWKVTGSQREKPFCSHGYYFRSCNNSLLKHQFIVMALCFMLEAICLNGIALKDKNMTPRQNANSSLSALAQAAWTWVQAADTQGLSGMVVTGEMKWPQ